MKIIPYPSPNIKDRDGHGVDMLVLHYTGMKTGSGALERLCDPASKVSAHYMIEENGDIYSLVHEMDRAWHAGVSFWRGHSNINQRSIGIEIVNPGHEYGYRPFTAEQMQSLIALCHDILARHDIAARNIVAHSDIAPVRKEDPGELFDWAFLAQRGIGVWPEGKIQMTGEERFDAQDVMRHLASYGYDVSEPAKSITAFQRHFRPKLLSGIWDQECAAILQLLLAS